MKEKMKQAGTTSPTGKRPSRHTKTGSAAASPADEQRLVEVLRGLKSQRSARGPRTAEALRILEGARSPRVRNAAALALADLRAYEAQDKLVELLARPETMGSRGTLLYALDQLKADLPLPLLADIVASESYEAREEALAFIRSNRFRGTSDEFVRAEATLESASGSADADRLEAIQRALRQLRGKKRSAA